MAGGRRITAAAALLILVGACGGGDKGDEADNAGRAGSEAPGPDAPGGDETTTSAPPAGGAPGAGAGGTPATTRAGTAGSSSAGATTTVAGRSGSSATASSASPRFAAPGGYIAQRSGRRSIAGFGEQSLDGEGSLTVDPPSGDDQRSFLDFGSSDTTDQTLRSRSGAVELVHLKTTTQVGSTEFRPAPPVLFAPDPLPVGRTWSWRITSTDGKVTVDGRFEVLRNENVTIGGEQVATTVVKADLTFSGDIAGTSRRTVWGAPAYRLAVRTDEVTDLTKPAVLHSESSSVLRSTRPR